MKNDSARGRVPAIVSAGKGRTRQVPGAGSTRSGAGRSLAGGRSPALDTPEQLDHGPPAGDAGEGVPEPVRRLRKRARRRALTQPLARELAAVAGGPLMGRAYERTATRCGQVIQQGDGSLGTWWCGARWCACCGAVRTARAWAAYGPTVEAWGAGRWLVTLTVPNCHAGALRSTVRQMHDRFNHCARALKRVHGAVQMIRATEVTYSGKRAAEGATAYHPHIHVIAHGEAVARALVDAWLERWPTARRAAQDAKPATAGALAEVFKYATKLASDVRRKDGGRDVVPARALDVIYTALRGLRLWQPVGVKALRDDEGAGDDESAMDTAEPTPAVSRPGESLMWEWSQGARDWVEPETGECLTGYEPGRGAAALLDLLEERAEAAEDARGAAPGDWLRVPVQHPRRSRLDRSRERVRALVAARGVTAPDDGPARARSGGSDGGSATRPGGTSPPDPVAPPAAA